ncbi:YbhB/YbcL family Raf kinase inhibitor-like protein [Methanolobus sediminis]|uniref:YbhB/YbcL family Raf kinase inhibitor-like protein n=1 Tax=Methanolobus sediminis TaxID=3072978 RepID=A0AA51UP95_9EURY|nr:YbhB/YbcL family Raf kinase inhibitor-like protein [Methanolobus sediminis]WMW25745.1 YbhB/YbcL family Raf kinase inhibitor-like protein [Methanolobus sediminis]
MHSQYIIRIGIIILVVFSVALSGCTGSDDVREEATDVPGGKAADVTDDTAVSLDDDTMISDTLTVTSSAFENAEGIPVKYTCDGEVINPDLEISGIPTEAVSLLLIMNDPDATIGTFTHWVVWNIPVDSRIDEDSIPGIEGKNSAGKLSYIGPCPPAGTHRYFFKVYALDTELDLESGSERALVEDAISGHVLAYGELMGTYSR